jgi:NhaA family Na+:H+ antiporter
MWANSPWGSSYEALWSKPIGLELDVRFAINDGLMTAFFFVAGLEIRQEMHHGELSTLRRAALPVIAAVGGMLVPALTFVVLARGSDTVRGWGVPMATDIAFAVGILSLLGSRVPTPLRVLLLALAVVDDLGAILVVALFYSSGLYSPAFWLPARVW